MSNDQNAKIAKDQILTLQSLLGKLPGPTALQTIGRASCHVLKNEPKLLLSDILTKDLKPKWNAAKDLGNGAKAFGNKLTTYFANVKKQSEDNGIKSALSYMKEDIKQTSANAKENTLKTLEETPKTIKQIQSSLISFSDQIVLNYQSLETEEEKGAYLFKLTLYSSLLGVSFYYGHELPDYDFALWGAGAHRSFLSHSALPFLTVKAVATAILRLLERSDLHLQRDPAALALSGEMQQCLKLLVFGFGAGTTFHLLVDGLVQTDGTIRLHGIFDGKSSGSIISGTRIDDMAYTTLMGLFSGYETKKVSVG
nr:hypothetical protein CKG001_32090 [Bdellovibrio sp. CKG001]